MKTNIIKWAPLAGKWNFNDTVVEYLGPENTKLPFGVILSSFRVRSGSIISTVTFNEIKESAGRILFGYNSSLDSYFSAGIGGYDFAYVLDEYSQGRGWKALKSHGSNINLQIGMPYELKVQIQGQSVSLKVDNIKVIDQALPYPPQGDQTGFLAWGPGKVKFENTYVHLSKPRAFVVMQFGEPYDSLYSEVIRPVSESMGLEAYRADDVYKPGIILQDIIRGILEAEVIIAEITPVNANVFYEIGYAHAMKKPTILLAERGRDLPFDIKSYRCIFYDNTIRGKKEVEIQLNKHLSNILNVNELELV